jgi:lipid-A-disaccharide synthase
MSLKDQYCLIIAGEKSGEEHAETFLPGLLKLRPQMKFFGVGGEYFESLGFQLLYQLKDFSVMGFTEALKKLSFFKQAKSRILEEVDKKKCRYAILIDYQEFNFNLAASLSKRGVKVFYYVAPQAWAWREARAFEISKRVHTLFCILPFEKDWFAQRGMKKLFYIGHPMVKRFESLKITLTGQRKKQVCFLPGSRESEVSRLLPVFEQVARSIKEQYQFESMVVISDSLSEKTQQRLADSFDHSIDSEQLFMALKESSFAIAASGTVNLACCLAEVPTMVCYKVSLMNEFFFHQVARYKGFASLVNIIGGEMVFPEYLQDHCQAKSLLEHFDRWMRDPELLGTIHQKILAVKEQLLAEQADFSIDSYISEEMNQIREDK